jgi:hypothetical protein
MVGIVGLHGYSLLENRMYLSKLWFGDDYKERRKIAKYLLI